MARQFGNLLRLYDAGEFIPASFKYLPIFKEK